MMVLYLGFVPLVSFVLPLLLIFLLYLIVPGYVLLPSITYLWKALIIGYLLNAATFVTWFQPSFAFGKKVGFPFVLMIGLVALYFFQTHAGVSNTLDLPYVASATNDAQVVGLIRYEPMMTTDEGEVIKIKYLKDETVYFTVQAVLLLVMLAAGGLALTKKTA